MFAAEEPTRRGSPFAGTEALRRLAGFLAETDTDPHQSAAGAKRERQLGKIIHILQEQTWQLGVLADELAAEERS
ncbi:hypothetical protein [Streptomyces anulatus]|uniref:hypothetical protein n=1 Tax=Streptomyces anulatus TaxID=1892 RepID=UPI0036A55E39